MEQEEGFDATIRKMRNEIENEKSESDSRDNIEISEALISRAMSAIKENSNDRARRLFKKHISKNVEYEKYSDEEIEEAVDEMISDAREHLLDENVIRDVLFWIKMKVRRGRRSVSSLVKSGDFGNFKKICGFTVAISGSAILGSILGASAFAIAITMILFGGVYGIANAGEVGVNILSFF